MFQHQSNKYTLLYSPSQSYAPHLVFILANSSKSIQIFISIARIKTRINILHENWFIELLLFENYDHYKFTPQFRCFSPIFIFYSFFYCNFFIALGALNFFSTIIAKIGHSSASSASFFFPFHGLTTIVFWLSGYFNVSMRITLSISLPSLVKSFPCVLFI